MWRVNLSGQNASISATDLVAASSVDGGIYVIKGVVRVTTAAGTSSSVSVRILYTEDDGGTAVSANDTQGFTESGGAAVVVTPVNATGNTGIFYFTKTINARAGVAIRYQTNYASNPASAMQYSLHLVCSRF